MKSHDDAETGAQPIPGGQEANITSKADESGERAQSPAYPDRWFQAFPIETKDGIDIGGIFIEVDPPDESK